MLSPILDERGLDCWRRLTDCTGNIIITAHSDPDGDAMGSSLGLAGYLRSAGKNVTVIMPNRFPDFLRWMDKQGKIIIYEDSADRADEAFKACGLIFCLDYNDLKRAGRLGEAVAANEMPKIMIDHHLNPGGFADLSVSHPEMSSTSELVFRLVWQLGGFAQLSCGAAAAIYCGMMTDTGAFSYNSSSPDIYYIIARLLEKGIDKDLIYRNVYHNYSRARIRLMGYVLHRKLHFCGKLRACIYTLTQDELSKFYFRKGDAEGLVNLPLMVRGMRLSIALREDTGREKIRVSLRSADDFPCNEMAERFFNGGGHLNAAGGELQCTMEEAEQIAVKAVEAYRGML